MPETVTPPAAPVTPTPQAVAPELSQAERFNALAEGMNRFKGVTPAAPVDVPKTNGKHEEPVPPPAPKAEAPKSPPVEVPSDEADPLLATILKRPEPAKPSPEPTEEDIDFGKPEFKTAPKQLRSAYEQLKANTKQLEQKLSEYEKSKNGSPDQNALAQKIDELTKKNQELEEGLTRADFQRSPKFKSEYLDPWQKTQERMAQFAAEFSREHNGQQKPLEWDDITPILMMPRHQARQAAKDLFGEDAQSFLAMKDEWLNHKQRASEAISNHKELYTKSTQQEQVEVARLRTVFDGEFNRLSQSAQKAFGVSEDPELKQAWTESERLVDAALFGGDVNPETRFKLGASVKTRYMLMPVLAKQNERLRSEVETLRAELAKVKASGPGSGGQPGGAPAGEKSIADGMTEFMARKRSNGR